MCLYTMYVSVPGYSAKLNIFQDTATVWHLKLTIYVPIPCNILQLLAVTGWGLTVNIRNLRDTTRLTAARILETRSLFVITELVYVYEPIPCLSFCPERWRNIALRSTSIVYHVLSDRLRNK
jgi:hypothetical protein